MQVGNMQCCDMDVALLLLLLLLLLLPLYECVDVVMQMRKMVI